LQRGFQQMDVADAHPWSQGEGIRVAIIDTGADTEHPDLRGNIAAAATSSIPTTGNFGSTVTAPRWPADRGDRNNREARGNRTRLRLLLFKHVGRRGSTPMPPACNSFTLARALVAAFDAPRANRQFESCGSRRSPAADLIHEGLRRGVLFVGAAPADVSEGNADSCTTGCHRSRECRNQSALSTVLYAPGRENSTLMPGGHYDFATRDSISTHKSRSARLCCWRKAGLSAADAYRLLHEAAGFPAEGIRGCLRSVCRWSAMDTAIRPPTPKWPTITAAHRAALSRGPARGRTQAGDWPR